MSEDIDDTDRAILGLLQDDGRMSLTDLASSIHVSVSTARTRVQRLVDIGAIRDYRARVDAEILGFGLHAVVRIKVQGAQFDRIAGAVERHPEITRCLRVTGETCYIAELRVKDMRDLERITSELALIGSITTDLVYEVVADRPTPVHPRT